MNLSFALGNRDGDQSGNTTVGRALTGLVTRHG
jgi:hypothetical protein